MALSIGVVDEEKHGKDNFELKDQHDKQCHVALHAVKR